MIPEGIHPIKKPGFAGSRAFCLDSLTMTYFRTGIRTIIGAESFHGPVRDGKGWGQLAMVVRLDGCPVALGAPGRIWKK